MSFQSTLSSLWRSVLDLLGGGCYAAGGLLHHHLLIRCGGDDDAGTAVIVGGREEVEARLSVFGMDAEEIYESVCEQIREDTLIPLTADLAPEVGALLAELRREVDEERDLDRKGHECMAHQLGIVFVKKRIAVVGDIDDEGILLAIALDNLFLPFREASRRSEGASYKVSR